MSHALFELNTRTAEKAGVLLFATDLDPWQFSRFSRHGKADGAIKRVTTPGSYPGCSISQFDSVHLVGPLTSGDAMRP